MATPSNILRSDRSIGVVQQTMTDYKIDPSKVRLDELMATVAEFRGECEAHRFSRGDKLPTHSRLRSTKIRDVIPLEFKGEALGKFGFDIDIPLAVPRTKGQVKLLHDALALVAHTEPGGNAFNELRDIAHCMEAGVGPETVQVYTSTDPLLEQWHASLSGEVRDRIVLTAMGDGGTGPGALGQFPPRQGLHLPYRLSDRTGTLAVSNPATTTIPYLRGKMDTLFGLDHTIASEGLSMAALRAGNAGTPFVQKLNPSSAFRSQCAIDSWEGTKSGAHPPFVTMNDDEFNFYLRCIIGRVEDTDPEKLDPIPFPSPFGSGDEVNMSTVGLANAGFSEYLRHIRPPGQDRLRVLLNVSCGAQGGYHLATKGNRRYLVFSTIPNAEGTREILSIAGSPPGLRPDLERAMGAGDSVGAVLSLARIWDLEELLAQYAAGNNGRGSATSEYYQAASMVFVSILSRIVGECLYRTEKCDLSDIPPANLRALIDHAARLALKAADDVWNVGPKPKQSQVSGGMKVALWELPD